MPDHLKEHYDLSVPWKCLSLSELPTGPARVAATAQHPSANFNHWMWHFMPGLVNNVVFGQGLDSMILEILSNLSDSMILSFFREKDL